MDRVIVEIRIPGHLDAEDSLGNALNDDGIFEELGGQIKDTVRDYVSEYLGIPWQSIEVKAQRGDGWTKSTSRSRLDLPF